MAEALAVVVVAVVSEEVRSDRNRDNQARQGQDVVLVVIETFEKIEIAIIVMPSKGTIVIKSVTTVVMQTEISAKMTVAIETLKRMLVTRIV